jgi:predicted dehydrogenase
VVKVGTQATRIAKQVRDATRRRSLERGESGWGSPVVPPPVIPARVGDPCRVAVVGAGIQGAVLARGASSIVGAELVALVDLDVDKARGVLDRLGHDPSLARGDAAAAFASASPDLAVIATTAPSHIALGQIALDAGVGRILLEKPIGTSFAESRDFVDRCERHGTFLAVNYVRRWLRDHGAVLEAVSAGQIGPLRILTAQVGAGELAMQGSHFIDLFRMFTGAEIVEVSARLRPPQVENPRGAQFDDPTGHLQLRFESGARAFIDFEPDLPARDIIITLRGDDGFIVIEEHQRVWTLRSRSGRTWTFPFAEPFTPQTFATRSILGALTDATPGCTGADGLAALEVILAAHHSSRDGSRVVSLPLDARQRELPVVFP